MDGSEARYKLTVAHLISEDVARLNGRTYFVGDFVRDRLMGRENADVHVEIHGLSPAELQEVLRECCDDTCLAVEADPSGDLAAACRRRVFTINAIMQDVLTGEIIDPYQGREDISKGIIRCVDSSTFGNDPLPVYQAVQLASRFGFSISPETMALLRSVSVEDLPGKCIRAEYTKLLLESPEPSIGLELLRELHLLPPEVEALIGCPQNPRFHPEGDAWNHTMLVLDKAATLRQRSMDPEAFMWAALLHDVGKPLAVAAAGTTRDHASLGEKPAREALLRLTSEERFIDAVCRLVRLHMAPAPLYFADASDDEVKSLSMEVSLNEIMLLVEADFYGRPVPGLDEAFIPEHIWWQDRINRLGANVPAPR